MATKKAKYKKLNIVGGKRSITIYAGDKVHDSYKAVAEKLSAWEGGQLINLLEAAIQEGRRQGSAEVIEKMGELKREIASIEKSTLHKAPGRPKKKV